MLARILIGLLSWQDPAPPPESKEAPVAPAPAPAPAAPVLLGDKEAKELAAELDRSMTASASMADRNRALDRVAGGSHALLLKPLASVVEKDKSIVLRKRAASLLRNQPANDAKATIRRLLKNAAVRSQPGVTAELVRGLSHCGYTPALWSEIDGLFEIDYQAERVPLQEALLDLITVHKEKQALPLLLRNLDEPAPENEHDASNPPQEYWEARWKAWAVWKGRVKEALFAVTGQRFSTAAEAKAWLKKNPLR
ncbi:MAG: hypothetical protein KF830_10885 [Planctomycetes bacterium]|nr:hypothetical protein [Planctomycetota bacterium]